MTQPDGKVLLTEGQGGGKVQSKDLHVTGSVVVPSHPGLRADLGISFRYDVAYVANFSSKPGMDDSNGLDGMDGTSGTPGSLDPNNPSPGGNGSDAIASDGKDGDPAGGPPHSA